MWSKKLIKLPGETWTHDHNWRYQHPSLSNQLKGKFSNTVELTTTNQLDLTAIYIVLQPTTTKYTLFSSSHKSFTETDYILGHKTHQKKFKRTELTEYMLSDHNAIKLESNLRKIDRKISKHLEIKHHTSK